MIASNRLFAACLFLAGAAFSSGSASSAESKPAAPAPATAPAPADGAAPVPPPPDPHAVAVDTLDAPHPDSMGLVGVAGGGFSDTLWQGTPAVTAQTLVSALPHRFAVPAARRLAIKFLLSAAPVEGGANASAMLEARILALAGMADWDDALALMDFVPAQTRSPMLMKARVTGFLVKGRIDAACGEARAPEDADASWAKLQILCQLASGQNSAVGVSLGLMREQGLDDKIFLWAADVAQGNTSAAPPADFARAAANGTVDPVVMAMLRQAGYLLPKAVVAAADPTTLLFAAQTAMVPPKAPEPEPEPPPPVKGKGKKAAKPAKPVKPVNTDELRLYTLERAAAVGVIDAEALRNVYATIALDNDDGVGASTDSISIDTARQRAATYQLAITQSVTGSRAEVIARVMDLTRLKPADAVPGPELTAQVYAPAVRELPVSPDLVWFAPTAVRILAAADGAAPVPVANSSANPWLDLLQAQAMTITDPAKSYAGVWPYARLTKIGLPPITPDESAAWQKTLPPDRAAVLRGVAFDLLTAVGDGLPASDLQAAMTAEPASDGAVSSAAPSTLLWNAIAQAERSGRIGEVTALSLRFLGADGSQPAPIAVTKALESLTVAGRSADARAIAVELALDRGL